jgi:DNA segregation ATPase FtsK/SpoIIIE-like protein
MNGLLTRRRAAAVDTLPELVWGDDTMCRPLAVQLGRGSILVGGSMGAGKSTVENAILAAASPRPDIAIIGIDPKRVELSPWRARLAAVGRTPDEIDQLITKVSRLMWLRYDWMDARGLRMWDPTLGAGSWVMLVIDELAAVFRPDASIDDRKHAMQLIARRREAIEELGSLGRAAGITIVTCTQTPSAEILGTDFRNNHTTRICLYVPNEHVATMVLGEVPEGVEPWTIPVGLPGTADVFVNGRVRRGRSRYFTDHDVARLAAGTAHVRQLAGTLDDLLRAVRP